MEQLIAQNRKAGRRTLACVLLLTLFFLLLLWRAPFGYDWTDEQYYSVVGYRILQGDRPLMDTWEVHQFSGILVAPVLGLYRLLNGGSMDGAVLYLRYFYVSFQFAVSLLVFASLRRKSGNIPALLAAGMTLAFTHFSINSLYYDSMTLLCTISSVMFLFLYREEPRRCTAFAFLSGICCGLAIVAFPYAAAILPVYLADGIIRFWRDRSDKKRIAGAVWFIAGGTLVAAALCGFLFARTSPGEAVSGIRNMLADPDHSSVPVLEVLGQYFNTIRVMYSPLSYGAAGLAAIGAAYLLVKQGRARAVLHRIGSIWLLILIAGIPIRALTYDWEPIYRLNMLAMGFAMAAPGMLLLAGGANDRVIFLYAVSCALSLATHIGSNTRILVSSGMLLPASMAALVYFFDHGQAIFFHDPAKQSLNTDRSAARRNRTLRCCAVALGAAVVLSLFALRATAVHRDEPIGSLTATIDSGAAKGIRTTPKSVELHHAIVEEIRTNAPDEGAILITYLFPEGYLLTGLRAATPSAFNMTLDSAWLRSYYKAHPGRIPSVVYVLHPDLQYNEPSLTGMDSFIQTYGMEEQQLAHMTVLFARGK